ncbi:MAG TPA: class I SAM-dependent methyltransferase [Candidatus Diapherotrites archaeon]|uniref:Class I SAM-dependent methyltransferase n=1 Tax=Candidatus Iainarchaeum sp. TaxID=3101447 RepID=A0A7J4IX11_9ARCH|nr:class I SAM-dependent methyltransferase [Candidatus Diapherotrites archaeon]
MEKKAGYTAAFVDHWADFINWGKRRKGENGFLPRMLGRHNCQRVFQSCLGDGCDSIFLLREGFEVVSNEFSHEFIKKARANARRYNLKLDITTFDWRDLHRHFDQGRFDAVLCLGNSLTHLFRKSDRIKTLENFKLVLRKGGILIIDERNYQYMLDCKKEILAGNFRYSGKYVYCGTKVQGIPVKIGPRKVVMQYTDSRDGAKSCLELYPFKRNELLEEIRAAGFRSAERYSDYRAGFNPKADFYTYVCVR